MLRNALIQICPPLVLCLLLAPPALAQDELPQKVARMLADADQASLPRAWEIARQLTELKGQEDAVVKAIGDAAAKLGSHGRLAAARALLDIADNDVHGNTVLESLRPVCQSDDVAARAAASP